MYVGIFSALLFVVAVVFCFTLFFSVHILCSDSTISGLLLFERMIYANDSEIDHF